MCVARRSMPGTHQLRTEPCEVWREVRRVFFGRGHWRHVWCGGCSGTRSTFMQKDPAAMEPAWISPATITTAPTVATDAGGDTCHCRRVDPKLGCIGSFAGNNSI